MPQRDGLEMVKNLVDEKIKVFPIMFATTEVSERRGPSLWNRGLDVLAILSSKGRLLIF
jgi:hypothetical protein